MEIQQKLADSREVFGVLKEQLAKVQNDYDALVKNDLPGVCSGKGAAFRIS